MRKILITVVAGFILWGGISCDKDKELRYTLARHAYQIGFIEGFIFTLDAAAHFLTGTLKAEDIDVEAEARRTWDQSGQIFLKQRTDSLGVVLGSTLSRGLFIVYRLAFSDGIAQGERYVRESVLEGKKEEQVDEQQMARKLFEEKKVELVTYVQGIQLERKPVPDTLK